MPFLDKSAIWIKADSLVSLVNSKITEHYKANACRNGFLYLRILQINYYDNTFLVTCVLLTDRIVEESMYNLLSEAIN